MNTQDNEPAGLTLLNSGTATLTHSNIEGGWPGVGNIDADPLFAGTGAHSYAITTGSPCIDAGDNAAVPNGVSTDLAGNPRFIDDACVAGPVPGAVVDMAPTSIACTPTATSTGRSTATTCSASCRNSRPARRTPTSMATAS